MTNTALKKSFITALIDASKDVDPGTESRELLEGFVSTFLKIENDLCNANDQIRVLKNRVKDLEERLGK